jgi:hypothetical protein
VATVETLADCDAIIMLHHRRLTDPDYTHEECWNMIDRWLDIRLTIMRDRDEAKGRKRLEMLRA